MQRRNEIVPYVARSTPIAIFSILLLCLLFGCGDENGEADKGGFGAHCQSTSDCEDGLFCPQSGYIKGQCTISCSIDNHTICASVYGDDAFCHVAKFCALKCGADASQNRQCAQGLHCYTAMVPDHCRADGTY